MGGSQYTDADLQSMVDYFNQEKIAGRIATGHRGSVESFWKTANEGGLLPTRTGKGMQYGHFYLIVFQKKN